MKSREMQVSFVTFVQLLERSGMEVSEKEVIYLRRRFDPGEKGVINNDHLFD